jgi:hypothetical protein
MKKRKAAKSSLGAPASLSWATDGGEYVWDEATNSYTVPDTVDMDQLLREYDDAHRRKKRAGRGRQQGDGDGDGGPAPGAAPLSAAYDEGEEVDIPGAMVGLVEALARFRRLLWARLTDEAKGAASFKACFSSLQDSFALFKAAIGASSCPAALQDAAEKLGELFPVLTSAQKAGVPAVVQGLCGLDDMYFAAYYAALVAQSLSPVKLAGLARVPDPVQYLADTCPHKQGQPLYDEAWKQFRGELGKEVAAQLKDEAWRGDDQPNPLLDIFRARVRESVMLLYSTGLAREAMASAAGARPLKDRHEPLCPSKEVRLWRDNCRDMVCHIFAYAVPNGPALACLKRFSPIVEVGAGSGYWAMLMRERGVDVAAMDIVPPAPDHAMANAYHGSIPPWTVVSKGGPQLLAQYPSRTLFMCYAPPDGKMALEALHTYTGKYMVLVGEWGGTTHGPEFEAELLRDWMIKERISLPNWANTAYEMTVWRRRQGAADQTTKLRAPLTCTVCSAPTGWKGVKPTPLKKCRWCRDALLCSQRCHEAYRATHDQLHKLRMVFAGPGDWSNPQEYEAVALTSGKAKREKPEGEEGGEGWGEEGEEY